MGELGGHIPKRGTDERVCVVEVFEDEVGGWTTFAQTRRVGRWVGGLIEKVEENEAVRMRYCELWVGGWERFT